MAVEHVNIADPDIHEPKGVAAADVGQVYTANGAGSGSWASPSSGIEGGYKDITSNMTSARGGGSNAPALTVFIGGIKLNAYGGSGTDEQFVSFHLPHDYVANTDITLHAHWSHIIGAPSGDVKWQFEYSYAQGYSREVFPATTTVTTTQTAGAQYTHHTTDDDDMILVNGTNNFEPDGIVVGRFYRDGSDGADTFGDAAYILFTDIHYQSTATLPPERNAPFTGH